MHLFNSLIQGEALKSRLQNLTSKNYKHHSVMWCKTFFDTLHGIGMYHQCDRQTELR